MDLPRLIAAASALDVARHELQRALERRHALDQTACIERARRLVERASELLVDVEARVA